MNSLDGHSQFRVEESAEEFLDFLDFEDRLTYVPEGLFSINYGGLPIQFKYEHRDSDVTVVLFHSEISENVTLPCFLYHSVFPGVDVNWLAVSDPTLALCAELKLSWYMGSERQTHLQDAIETAIRRISVVTGIGKNFIFYGSSSGGFAALEMSHRFRDSLCVPVNPQTSLRFHGETTVGQFLDVAWPTVDGVIRRLPNSVRTDLVTLYDSQIPNTVAYLQNSRDTGYIARHALPFFRAMPNDSTVIPGPASVYLYLKPWGKVAANPHVPPPNETLAKILSTFAQTRGAWGEAMEELGFTRELHSSEIRAAAEQSTASQKG